MTIDINDRPTSTPHLHRSRHAATTFSQTSGDTDRTSPLSNSLHWTYETSPSNAKDESTLDLVQRALQHCGYEQLRRVHAYCHHGRVVLQGRVATYYLKQVAQEVVLNITGVRDVDNDLHVVCSR